ncbi:MAG: hypothetical protein IK123_11640, partial [Lachnospiraceae bacterium]|nr:hypothetical protein [Lachnospiraceae bacterium]
YRAPIPQQTVREEIVKGSGTQFDPKFAKIMQHLIDLDSEYEMKEKIGVQELAGKNELYCDEFRNDISEGIILGPAPTIKHISLKCSAISYKNGNASPSIILFDSLDGRYHDNPIDVKNLNYFEYATLWLDGRYECLGARRITVSTSASTRPIKAEIKKGKTEYTIDAVKVKDHIQLKIDDTKTLVTMTIALPDSARYAYIGLTGDNCKIYDLEILTEKEYVSDDYIPRIAEEISYIKDRPVGDIPNIQIDGYRTDSTEGITVRDGMQLTFHTMSLPTARLIWHTAYIDLFYSSDRKISGDDYREYSLIRLDGESWEAAGIAENKMNVNMSDDFKGWDEWKSANKEGFECTVTFKRDGNRIVTSTDNFGIGLNISTTVLDDANDVYVALSGDQVALTNIRIIQPTFSI